MAVQVKPGDKIEAVIVWKNIGYSVYAPQFRLDLRRSGTLETWNEGSWATSPSVAPGAQGTATAPKYVPTDWSPTSISAKVMLNGREGALQTFLDAFQIPTPIASAADVQIISIGITGGSTGGSTTPVSPTDYLGLIAAMTLETERNILRYGSATYGLFKGIFITGFEADYLAGSLSSDPTENYRLYLLYYDALSAKVSLSNRAVFGASKRSFASILAGVR